MSYDSQGKINDYGVKESPVNMGLLIYKSVDYEVQTCLILEKYLGEKKGSYVDITKFIGLWEPNREYKKSLQKRGVLK